MPKVVHHPVVCPPESFDLMGLSTEEIMALHAILGCVEYHGSQTTKLFSALDDIVYLQLRRERMFTIKAENGQIAMVKV